MICLWIQCAEEGQGSGEDTTFTAPRLLSGSEMKTLLQWEDPESHPLSTLEKQITVQITYSINYELQTDVSLMACWLCVFFSAETV